jgi:hypothetical protein
MELQVDVWGGEASQDLVARYRCTLDDPRIKCDLERGYLLNVLHLNEEMLPKWRDTDEFDERQKG